MRRTIAQILALLSLTSCHYLQQGANSDDPANKAVPTANEKIEANFTSIQKNIVVPKCVSCHKADSGVKNAQDIPLQTEEQILTGGIDDGPLIVPGKAVDSPFYKVMVLDPSIRGDLKQMPPQKAIDAGHATAVTEEEQRIVANWIDQMNPKTQEDLNPAPVPVPTPDQPAQPAQPTPEQPTLPPVTDIKFEQIKATVLDTKCITCHKAGSGVKHAQDMPFETREQVITGVNDDGPILVTGKPLESAFYKVFSKDVGLRDGLKKMPPQKAIDAGKVQDVTDEDMKLVELWIQSGVQ